MRICLFAIKLSYSKSDYRTVLSDVYLFSDNPLGFGFGTRAPSGLLIFFSLPLRQAKSITPHQNLDSTYTNEKFYENTKIKKIEFFSVKNLKNLENQMKREILREIMKIEF